MGIAPLLSIGLPLVRILLRLQQPSTGDLADSIKDFDELLASVKDRGDRREIGRNLEHISDRVIRRLDRFIQIEFRKADEGDIAAAATVVSQALMQAGGADLTVVVRNDVQVRALEQHALAHSAFLKEARDLGGDAEQLAHALLRETCYEIVELARRHPNLTVSALVSLLSRSSELRELLDSVERSLNDLPARVADVTSKDRRTDSQRAFDEFAVDYRRAVANDQDKLELYGVDLIRDVRRYSLTTAYLSLRLAASLARDDQPDAGDIATMLPKHGLAVLRGAAGAGKTTILQWLATNVARRTLDGSLAHLNKYVPFVVKLRNYSDKPFPPIAELAEATTQSTLVEEPSGWTSGVFRTGSVLLLIDGLDELPDRRQADLVNWLDGFQQFGWRILVVLTSRPSAEAMLRDVLRLHFSNARVADVLPLDRDQIRSFVLHWHTAISSQFTGAERAAIEGQAAKVAAKISSDREYRLLASSPLLCAVLCALFHLKRGILPAHRIEIYDTLLNLLLGDRDAHKRVDVDDVRLGPTEKRMVLEDVADFLLTNELSESTDERIVEVVARSTVAHRFGESTPQNILKHFLARSGVLRAPSEGSVDFVHRTFLEYLAARSLVRHDRIEMLASKVLQANWNEAIVLAAGIGIERQVQSLVGSVVAQAESAAGDHSADLLLLTVTCAGFLDTALVLSYTSRSRILRIVSGIVPPVDEASARACAAAGNSLLPQLRDALQDSNLSSQALHTSIRTLGEIGTAEALAVLSAIPVDLRTSAINELVSVWSWFELQTFADVVLKDQAPSHPVAVTLPNSTLLPHIKGLHRNFLWECAVEVPEESFVDNCRNVHIGKLSVSNLHIVNDERARAGEFLWTIHGLRQLRAEGLRTLRVTSDADRLRSRTIEEMALRCRRGHIDADVWPYLPSLAFLEIEGAADVDFRGLCTETLWRLTIDGNVRSRAPADFDLPGLEELRWIDSADTDLLMSIVDSAPNLRSLLISGVAGLTNLDFLSSAAALREVELTDIENLSDISTLIGLVGLTSIHIRSGHSLDSSRSLELLASEVEDLVVDGIDVRQFSWPDDDGSSSPRLDGERLEFEDDEDRLGALDEPDEPYEQYANVLYDEMGEEDIDTIVEKAEIELEDPVLAAELEAAERDDKRQGRSADEGTQP